MLGKIRFPEAIGNFSGADRIPVMFPVLRCTILRFFRLRIWIPALLLPALAAAFPMGPAPEMRAAQTVLLALHWVLPALAALFVLAPSREIRTDLLLVRPVWWSGIIFGRWLGTLAVFGACHCILAVGLAATAASSVRAPAGRVARAPDERFLEIPGRGLVPGGRLCRPWPSGTVDRAWLEALRAGKSWRFVFGGLDPEGPLRIRIRALLARTVPNDPEGKTWAMERLRSMEVSLEYRRTDGLSMAAGTMLLRDGEPSEVEVPGGAVDASGRLVLVLEPSGGEDPEGSADRRDGRFFWFDPSGGGDPLAARDAQVISGSIPFASNALRAGIKALGGLLLVIALGIAASSLFSTGIAIAFVLVVHVLAGSRPFLLSVIDTLSHESAIGLFSGPEGHHEIHNPTWFDGALEAFLRLWMRILPDLSAYRGGAWLFSGEAIGAADLVRSLLEGGVSAAVLLAAAILLGRRGEERS